MTVYIYIYKHIVLATEETTSDVVCQRPRTDLLLLFYQVIISSDRAGCCTAGARLGRFLCVCYTLRSLYRVPGRPIMRGTISGRFKSFAGMDAQCSVPQRA